MDNEKPYVVAGLGVSGTSAVQVLAEAGATVLSADERKSEADIHQFDDIASIDAKALVVSPGFNPRTPFIVEAQQRGIPVISEVELAWQMRVANNRTGKPAPWIGITGTNGKTTTTQMVATMLTAAGFTAPAVGNIGDPVSRAARDPHNDVLCVELSSFQLHFTSSLACACAVMTNIADDHLDWHGSLEAYIHDKAHVYRNVERTLVYNAQDEHVREVALSVPLAPHAIRVGFTLEAPEAGQIGVERGVIVDRSGVCGQHAGERVALAPVSSFRGLCEPDGSIYPHLMADALAALALVLGYGANRERAIEALQAFNPGGHRIEEVARLCTDGGQIRFIDDSKATNAHAAKASIMSFAPSSVVWIAGGLAKGARFGDLVSTIHDQLKAVVVIGVDQEPMREALTHYASDIPVTYIDPELPENSQGKSQSVMHRCLKAAISYAEPSDVILLAPACASMDQFVSYADRGNQFSQEAQAMVQEYGKSN